MNKNRYVRRLRDQMRTREGGDGHGWHSSAYHRFFEDYQEREVTNERGKVHIERIYCGTWYTRDLSRGQNLRQHLLYVLLWLLGAGFTFFLASRSLPVNSAWYIAIGQFASLICMLWVFGGWFRMITSPRRMTIGDYRASSLVIRRGSIGTMATLTATAVGTLLHALLAQDAPWQELLVALGYVVPVLVFLLLNRLEANLPYLETPSEYQAPADGVEIS